MALTPTLKNNQRDLKQIKIIPQNIKRKSQEMKNLVYVSKPQNIFQALQQPKNILNGPKIAHDHGMKMLKNKNLTK